MEKNEKKKETGRERKKEKNRKKKRGNLFKNEKENPMVISLYILINGDVVLTHTGTTVIAPPPQQLPSHYSWTL